MAGQGDREEEIKAMRELLSALEPFDAQTRRRMLNWLVARQLQSPGYDLPVFPLDEVPE